MNIFHIAAPAPETLKDMSDYIDGMKIIIGCMASVIGGLIIYLRTVDARQQKRIDILEKRIDDCEADRIDLREKLLIVIERQDQRMKKD